MTQSTRQEILEAHAALKHLISYDLANAYTEAEVEEVHEREQLIRKFLPPKPQPTMAEVEWDDEQHYLAEAESHKLGKVVMLRKTGGLIEFTMKPYTPQTKGAIWPENLTPTGRRYTLTEVQDD